MNQFAAGPRSDWGSVWSSVLGMSAMFDWSDEELANLVWDERGENDDHIVPYPNESIEKPSGSCDGSSWNWNWEAAAAAAKPAERKKPTITSISYGFKLQNNSDNEGSASDGELSSWTDLSLSNSIKTGQHPVGTEQPNHKADVSNNDSSRADEKFQIDDGSELPEYLCADREESDIVDYSWANIGSFDDLDRIFSNDDQMFGPVDLVNAYELWSTSKDATSSPERSTSLSLDSPCIGFGAPPSTTEHLETEEHVMDQHQPFTAYRNVNNCSSHLSGDMKPNTSSLACEGKSRALLNEKATLEISFNSTIDGRIPTLIKADDQVTSQRKPSKGHRRPGDKGDVRKQVIRGVWSPFGPQYKQFGSQYKNFLHPLLPASVDGTMGFQYPVIPPLLPYILPPECIHQQVPSHFEVSIGYPHPSSNSSSSPMKPLNMTPQEKIEKLRRRQQMRAMLAIQKQRKQLSHRVSSNGCSCTIDNRSIEDRSSPTESKDPNALCVTIDHRSIEDEILNQLQVVIAKLDVQIRLCIRDSLLRLAESSMQRKHALDTSILTKSSKDELNVQAQGLNSPYSFEKLSDAETETNPIDRVVAHLLFHRPLDLLWKHREALEFKVANLNTSENASNNGAADGEAVVAEVSQ